MKIPFERFRGYTRREVAQALAPDYPFQAQRGTWGAHGIVRFWGGPNFAFFVTYGQSQAGHDFDEGISSEGIFRWQSQPGQSLAHPVIRQLIEHDELRNEILLFLRIRRDGPYHFLGRLKYVQHDSEREMPVHFQWKIIDLDTTDPAFLEVGIPVEQGESETGASLSVKTAQGAWMARDSGLWVKQATLTECSAPIGSSQSPRTGISTREFKRPLVDYEERDRKNRSVGFTGEHLVLEHEKRKLVDAGKHDLARNVEHVARTVGDHAGFDIRSFHPEDESEVHIEVKTTLGPASTPFFMSRNEVEYSRNATSDYRIYRVFGLSRGEPNIQYYAISPPLESGLILTPTQFRARLR